MGDARTRVPPKDLGQPWPLSGPLLASAATIAIVGFGVLYAAGGWDFRWGLSARVDGADPWHRLFYIIIPLLRPTMVNLAILDVIGKMKQFALVWVMTRGGPMWGTETVATYVIKRAFEWKTLDLGYPSAIAVLWFIIIFGLSVGLTRFLQRREALEF